MRRLAVLAGTGVGPLTGLATYHHWLDSPRDALFWLPGRGLDDLDSTYRRLERHLIEWNSALHDGPLVLAGHSQGAYHAVRFALSHPARVSSVIAVGGPFGGAVHPPFVPEFVAKAVAKLLPIADDFKADSMALKRLQHAMEMGWPSSVSLTMIAGARDALVRPRRSAHSLQCAGIRKIYVGPWRPSSLPADIEHAWAPLAGHTSQIFMPPVVRAIREAQEA